MNKGITILILLVVLGAMGLVFYSHTRQSASIPEQPSHNAPPQTADNPAVSPPAIPAPAISSSPQAPRAGSDGLRQIEPPLSSARPNADGAPAPVKVTPGNAGVPQPIATPSSPAALARTPDPVPAPGTHVERPASPAPVSPGQESAGRISSSAPGLTPWGTPPSTVAPAPGQSQEHQNTQANTNNKPLPQTGKPPVQENGKTPSPTPQVKEPVLSDKGAHALQDMGLHFSGQGMVLRIAADNAFPCKTFVLTNPDRLVIDLPGTWKNMKGPTVPQSRLVKNVRLGAQPAGPRIVLDMTSPPKGHKVQRAGNVVEIVVQ